VRLRGEIPLARVRHKFPFAVKELRRSPDYALALGSGGWRPAPAEPSTLAPPAPEPALATALRGQYVYLLWQLFRRWCRGHSPEEFGEVLRWRTLAGSAAAARRLHGELIAGGGEGARRSLVRFLHHLLTRSTLTLQGQALRRRAWRRARHNWGRRALRRRLRVRRSQSRRRHSLRRTAFAPAAGTGEKQPFLRSSQRRRLATPPPARSTRRRRPRTPTGYRGRRADLTP
jgi:hypothetical protein